MLALLLDQRPVSLIFLLVFLRALVFDGQVAKSEHEVAKSTEQPLVNLRQVEEICQ